MSQVSKQYAEDEAFREVANLLFGDGSEIRKSSPDGADLAASRKKSERTQTNIARASNVVGIAAGGFGLKDALSNPHIKGKLNSVHVPRRARITGKTKGLAIAAAGLQAANLGGDAVTTAVLRRSANKEKKKVSKSRAKNLTAGGVGLAAGGTLVKLADDRDKIKNARVKKGLTQFQRDLKKDSIKETAQKIPKSKGALTRAVAMKGSDQVVVATRKGGAGVLKKLPAPVKTKPEDTVKKGDFDVRWDGEISKMNVDKQQVFGWASIVEMNGEPVVDLQGDYISIEEVEKSAYEYVQKSRKGGDMHLRDGFDKPVHASEMIESFIVTPEKKEALGLPDSTPVGWWVGYQVNDPEVWAKVKNGERTGFSIHGRGNRSEM